MNGFPERWIAAFAVVVALAISAPALAQVSGAVQEALFNYLTNIAFRLQQHHGADRDDETGCGDKIFVLDVREEDEFGVGHIQGAVNTPIRTLGKNIDRLPAKSAIIVVACRSGVRAAYMTMTLDILGYASVKDIAFSMSEWEKQGYPMVR